MPKLLSFLIPIFLLFFICRLSAAHIWLDFFNQFKDAIPTANHDESEFKELITAEPLFDEMFADILVVPPSPVHPAFQKHYLESENHENPQQAGTESSKKTEPKKTLSRQMGNSFKGIPKQWQKMKKALKGDGFMMMKNAKRMVQTIKEMEDGKVKAAILRTISDAAKAKQMLTSPLGDQQKFVENVKLHCTAGLLALLPKDKIAALEPFKFVTLTDQWEVIKIAGKLLLEIYKTPKYGENCGGDKHNDDDGHNGKQRKTFYRLLKTFTIPEILADPELLKKREDEEENTNPHVAHGGPRRRRKRQVLYIALFIALFVLGAIWVGLQKCCK